MRQIKRYAAVAVALIMAGASLFAQDDTKKDAQAAAAEAAKMLAETPETVVAPPKPVYWTNTLTTSLNFDQTSFTSWAAGGKNNYKLNTVIRGNANWAKNKMYWNNALELDYGFMYQEDKPIITKYMDRLKLTSLWGYKVTDKLSYTAQFIYNGQNTNGWNYRTPTRDDDKDPTAKDWRNARVLQSGFMSPGYTTLGLGMAWIPNKWLTVNFAPLTGSTTTVLTEKLRKNYGMSRKKKFEDLDLYPDEKDEEGTYFITGKYYKPATFAFGAQLTANVKFKINNKIDVASNLILFSNYLKNPQNFRVNWDNTIIWKLNKFFSFTCTTNLIYDDTVLINDDPEKYPNGHKAVQLKEYMLFGFTYSFSNKK